jgi:uncharacterized protein
MNESNLIVIPGEIITSIFYMSTTNVGLSATFHLTHDCNLRCTYCYTGEKKMVPMSEEVADMAVDLTLAEAQKRNAPWIDVTFFGGEPLLEQRLIWHIYDRFQAHKSQIDLYFKTSTNGLLLNGKTLEELTMRRIYVSISCDGPPDIHDRQRPNAGGKPTSHAVGSAMKRLLQSNPAANATCVLVPETAGDAARAIDFLYETGFRYINLVLDFSAPWTMADMDILEKSYRQIAQWYEQKIRAGHRFWLSSVDERIRSHVHRPPAPEELCSLGGKQFSFAPDGAIYPCIQFVKTEGVPEYMIGHVLHGGFDQDCRDHLHHCSSAEKPECKGCVLQARCSTHCSCVNFASTGRIDRASPVACHFEQRILPIVDGLAARLFEGRNRMFLHKHYNPTYPIIEHLETIA